MTPIHLLQYELLTEQPYRYNHKELTFEVYLRRAGIEHISPMEKQDIWDQLFTKGHPCLRASSLTKRYGFGAHYDADGKIGIYPMESSEYQQFVNDPAIKKIFAMKNKR